MDKQNVPVTNFLVLDGAVGTELLRRGAPFNSCLELWAAEHPDILQSIHADYIEAGADIIYTATFGANRFRLKHFDLDKETFSLNLALVQVAINTPGKNRLIAGCIGPTGTTDIPEEEIGNAFYEQTEALVTAGVDLIAIETMTSLYEASIALRMVKQVTDIPVFVSMVFSQTGLTMDGFSPARSARELGDLEADGVGCNCLPCSERMLDNIRQISQALPSYLSVLAKPNAGLPEHKDGELVYQSTPEDFAKFCKQLKDVGATMIGGCCGTTPEHISRLKEMISLSG